MGVDDPAEVERDLKLMLHQTEAVPVDNRRPSGLHSTLRRIPEAHFLRYMNALAGRDFATALEELQRYFDFGVCKGGDANAGLVGPPDRMGGSLEAHYAILNLAVLHFHFGLCFAVSTSIFCSIVFVRAWGILMYTRSFRVCSLTHTHRAFLYRYT